MSRLSARISLLAIILVFALPMALAWLLYTGAIGSRPSASENLGTLVQPVVPVEWKELSVEAVEGLEEAGMEGYWVIIHPLPETCGADCLERVTGLRQLHRATGRNQERLKILLLSRMAPDPDIAHELWRIYPEFSLGSRPSAEFSSAMQSALPDAADPNGNARFYLVDPLGNIMMTYAGDDAPEKMKKDLKLLLTWSNQDNRP